MNVLGALLLGVLVGADGWGRPRLLLLAGTGFLGAFTTFSTWMLELVQLTRDGYPVVAAAYLAVALAGGVVAAAVGIRIGRASVRPAPAPPSGPPPRGGRP